MAEPAIPGAFPDGSFDHHNVHYIETIVFRVENTLFRVPRRGFELESLVFATMFTLPAGDHNPEGRNDNTAIVLQGIRKRDFENFLALLYPMGPDLPVLGHEDLVGVLHLATMWEFEKIRRYVVKMMNEDSDARSRGVGLLGLIFMLLMIVLGCRRSR